MINLNDLDACHVGKTVQIFNGKSIWQTFPTPCVRIGFIINLQGTLYRDAGDFYVKGIRLKSLNTPEYKCYVEFV